MIKRIVEISLGTHCSIRLDNLIIKNKEKEVLLPLEDLGCLIVDNPATVFSVKLLVSLAEHNIAVIFCGDGHIPQALLLPYNAHHLHTKIIHAQAYLTEPKKKKIWQTIVKAKIQEQAKVLELIGNKEGSQKILHYLPRVLSGDSQNIEGVVASIYFKELFGGSFKRSYPGGHGQNSLLNYGYAIVRSLAIRGVCGAGLHPSLGVFHKNQFNPYCLGDDLMEITRPLIDYFVYKLNQKNIFSINTESKKELLQIMLHRIYFEKQETSLLVGMQKFSQSLVQFILEEKKQFVIPKIL